VPASPVQLNPGLPVQLEPILNKTLEKDRELRCQTAAELRADLQAPEARHRFFRAGVSAASQPSVVAARKTSRRANAWEQTHRSPGWPRSAPRSWGRTARREAILAAYNTQPAVSRDHLPARRHSLGAICFGWADHLYSAAWQGNPVEIFSARPGAAESRSLGLEHTQLLAVSPTGEMAVALNSHRTGTWVNVGTLASAPLAGGAPRELLENVQWADWAPDGSGLAVVRDVGGRNRLNIPSAKCSTRPEAGSAIPYFSQGRHGGLSRPLPTGGR